MCKIVDFVTGRLMLKLMISTLLSCTIDEISAPAQRIQLRRSRILAPTNVLLQLSSQYNLSTERTKIHPPCIKMIFVNEVQLWCQRYLEMLESINAQLAIRPSTLLARKNHACSFTCFACRSCLGIPQTHSSSIPQTHLSLQSIF